MLFRDLYKFKGILGQGQFGVVLLVTNIADNEKRALKIIYKSRLHEQEIEIIRSESEILQKLITKTNIVQSFQVSKTDSLIGCKDVRKQFLCVNRDGVYQRWAAQETL